MNTDPDEPENPSLRYWKAAIGSLTPAKRDAAWEFYLTHLAEGKAGDTLSAIVLLLEANGVYLQQLPERYHREIIAPLKTQMVSLQQRLAEHEDSQREIAEILERTSRENAEVSIRTHSTTAQVETSLRQAAMAVDTRAITDEVRKQIQQNALKPLTKQLQELATRATQIDGATESARSAVETWRRTHLAGIVLCGWGFGLIVFLALAVYEKDALKQDAERRFVEMRDQFIADLGDNKEALRKLADHGISMKIAPLADSEGKIRQDSLAMIIDPAQGADFDTRDGKNRGIVYLKPVSKAHVSFPVYR